MNVIEVSDNHTLAPTSDYKHGKWEFSHFNPVQTKIMEIYEGDSNCAIAAATSAGKAQPLYAPVLTPKGFIKMGDIKVGAKVIGSNGNPTQVTGVFPQGKKRVYRVVFSDGATAHCCEDHLWSVRTRHDKCQNRPFKVKPLKELFGDLRLKDGQNKWFVPLIEPDIVQLNNIWHKDFDPNYFADLPIHPYVLGVLLGDGGIKHGVKLSSGDDFIIKQMELLLPKGVFVEYLENYDYQIVGGMNEPGKACGFNKTNLIKDLLTKLGLFGLGSCDKFIPQIYLDADPASRLELLRGLMDTDGTANGDDRAAEFTSCSKTLAVGVCQLARSLGAATCVRRGKAGYKDSEANYVECKDRYRVTVNLGGNLNPFWMPRKSETQQVGLEKGRNRSIDRIEVRGEQECLCISVSASDQLYVTSDYILTHNTVAAEMYLAYEIRKRGGKGIYIGPMKSLAKEKEDEWTFDQHHFHDLKVSITTGDFRFTAKRIKEIEDSNIIIMTPEMLASRCRNHKSDKSQFLADVGTVIFDESHLLTVPSRGDHIEVALMKIVEINPNVRIVLLSATMPNVNEICGWISKLTGRTTYYLKSDYRPCPLSIHYEKYYDGDKSYWEKESQKISTACAIVEYYPNDKFLIFVHSIETGKLMVKQLERQGVKAEFHNSIVGMKERIDIETRFKNEKSFRVVVATSTLAWGNNLPARRVIVTGVHSGLREVENYNIQQMIGRAGRPKYDPRGDAYILVPESTASGWITKLQHKPEIKSTLLDFVGKPEDPHYKTLAFHIVAEIHQGNIKTKEAFHEWFRKSLAHFQDHDFNDALIDKTIELLRQYGAVTVENEEYSCTPVGIIASMFYYSPFDVSDFRRNFKKLFEEKRESDDYAVSIALGNIDTHRWGICNRNEREAIAQYTGIIEKMYGVGKFTMGAIKMGAAYYYSMIGRKDIPQIASIQGQLMADIDRTMQVINAIDQMNCKWDKRDWFNILSLRCRYGVAADLVQLVQIPNVGAVRAGRLKKMKIKTVDDFLCYDVDALMGIMKCGKKLAEEAIEGAKAIQLRDSIN